MRRRPDTTRSSRTSGEFRLQAVGRQPLYDGGARRAAVARAEAGVDAAAGRYRIEEKDLILEVTSRYAESLAALEEASARRSAISRLESYRTNLKSRQASGQAVAADLIKTEVRLASEEANILEAERRADEARITLAALMGRAPADSARARALARSRSRGAGGARRLGERAGNRRRGRRGAGRGCRPGRARVPSGGPILPFPPTSASGAPTRRAGFQRT